jgi:hypothetical protein
MVCAITERGSVLAFWVAHRRIQLSEIEQSLQGCFSLGSECNDEGGKAELQR